jgi:large subunit ribosomal protein L22
MDVRAKTMHASISAQKLRLVVDQVRGRSAAEALVILKFIPKKGAAIVSKTLTAAIANAVNNFELDADKLVIKSITADGGPMLKRYKAGARGRYKPRKRRTAHLTIILTDNAGAATRAGE